MSGPVIAALLHEGGWDELLMVGAGLVLAYVIIMATGRRGADEDDAPGVADATGMADEDAADIDEPSDRRA